MCMHILSYVDGLDGDVVSKGCRCAHHLASLSPCPWLQHLGRGYGSREGSGGHLGQGDRLVLLPQLRLP